MGERKGLILVDISELASRWGVYVVAIERYIVECGMNPLEPEKWFVDHSDLVLKDKEKLFDEKLRVPPI